MLVLEKKQQGTWQQSAGLKNDTGERKAEVSETGEPAVPYQSTSGYQGNSNNPYADESISGETPFNDPVSGQNEDDLPF